MKQCFTNVFFIFLLFFSLGISVFGQTTHQVNVSGFSFTPANLVIDVGDQVVWTNTGGFHNVNGTLNTYANNPASFGNSLQNAPWEFSFVFNVAGVYDYQCDAHVSSGMVGTITVNTATSIDDNVEDSSGLVIYPQPASDYLNIELSSEFTNNSYQLFIYNLLGSNVFQIELFPNTVNRIYIDHIPASTYLYRIQSEGSEVITGKLMVR